MMIKNSPPIVSKYNHWHSVHADGLELLIDAKAYYKEFFASCRNAQKSIILAGWVMEDRLLLSKHNSDLPDSLVEFFKSLTIKKPDLSIYTMVWTPGRYLDFGRQSYKESRWRDARPSNFRHFRDRSRYLFASRHEKYALIDGRVLYIGGMDITSGRYDDRDHEAQFQYRRLPGGKKYKPRHDVQLKIMSAIDQKFLDLPQKRCQLNGAQEIAPSSSSEKKEVPNLYLSRTDPESRAFEIEALYLDAIMSAKNWIYIENQYFTNERIAKAIEKRLKEKDPPEIVLVSSMTYSGVFERAIFERKRSKLLNRIYSLDHKKRFHAFYPSIPKETKDSFVVVHSKLMAVDGRFLTVGSANINERSMRVDTELNASVEAKSEKDKMSSFVFHSVCDLLSEHLDVSPESMSKDLKERGLLASILINQKKEGRTLRSIRDGQFSWWEKLAYLISAFVDIKIGVPKHG